MARYDYRCTSCDKVFEVEHPMGETPEVKCPECGGECERVFGTNGIVFKGSGFYNTDQRGSSSATPATGAGKDNSESAKASSQSTSETSGSTASDSKPAARTAGAKSE